jgi:predicted nucleic acid-binding Zn ribbon protein
MVDIVMKICPKCGTKHEKNGKFCSRTCANSRVWSEEDKRKKSESVRKTYSIKGHPQKGKPGWKHSDELKELKRQLSIKHWDEKRIRLTPEEKAAKNRHYVSLYRARLLEATCPTANLKLIRMIYENCPKGYDVDHIVSLNSGGPHHENNLQYLPLRENRKKQDRGIYDESLVIRWQDVLKES